MDAEMKSSIWRRLIFSGEKQPEANTLDVKERRFEPLSRRWFIHSARTALAAVLSLYAARALRLPEAYWAAVSTIVVMQSTLGAAFEISEKTFIGTALGCGLAMLLARYFETNGIVFGAAVFGVGLLCSILRLDKSAYQFAGITLTIVLLAAGNRPIWIVGVYRFIEVSAGIAVGLMFTALWPEAERPQILPSSRCAGHVDT